MSELPTREEVHEAAKVAGAAIAAIIAEFASTYHVRVTGVEVMALVVGGDNPSVSYGAFPICEMVAGELRRD